MTRFLLDTNILVGYLRGAEYAASVEKKFKLSESPNLSFISVVSVGEIYSLAFQFGWGAGKLNSLKQLLQAMPVLDLNIEGILKAYARIDAYSYNKLKDKKMPSGCSAKPMGKNDVWIAATANVTEAALITTDGDFDHLNGDFVNLIRISQKTGDVINGK